MKKQKSVLFCLLISCALLAASCISATGTGSGLSSLSAGTSSKEASSGSVRSGSGSEQASSSTDQPSASDSYGDSSSSERSSSTSGSSSSASGRSSSASSSSPVSIPASSDSGSSSAGTSSSISTPDIEIDVLRGVLFNPNIYHPGMDGYPWPVFDPYNTAYRTAICKALKELSDVAHINFICIFIPIPFTLKYPAQGNQVGQTIEEWANLTYLNNVALFVDDCYDAGIAVELDLADNRWIPYSIDTEAQLGKPGDHSWPMADYSPWNESALWYSQIIEYIEPRAKHPENIAMWGMMGNYQLGTAEPMLWGNDYKPEILLYTEKFVKRVWPVFKAAGKRPKIAPYAFPLMSDNWYWKAKTPEQRLEGFTNIKKWLVDDLKLPPDYWGMSTYPYCDPASDGFYYLKRIVEILGEENASRIISTDFKSIGPNLLNNTIIKSGTHTEADMLEWNFQKCKEYGFGGWWIYSYQDQIYLPQLTGIRDADGNWKPDLLEAVLRQSEE